MTPWPMNPMGHDPIVEPEPPGPTPTPPFDPAVTYAFYHYYKPKYAQNPQWERVELIKRATVDVDGNAARYGTAGTHELVYTGHMGNVYLEDGNWDSDTRGNIFSPLVASAPGTPATVTFAYEDTELYPDPYVDCEVCFNPGNEDPSMDPPIHEVAANIFVVYPEGEAPSIYTGPEPTPTPNIDPIPPDDDDE